MKQLKFILIPLTAGALYVLLSSIKLSNLLYYGLHSTYVVIIPILSICILIVILFHLINHLYNIKTATITIFILALALGLTSFLKTPDGHLADLLESIYLSGGKSETVVISDPNLFRISNSYPQPETPLLSSYPDDSNHFWLVSYPSETSSSPTLEGYEVTDEISTPYYLALKLQKSMIQ